MIEIRNANEMDANDIASVMIQFYNMDNLNEAKNAFFDELKKGHNFIVSVSETRINGFISWLSHGLPKHGLSELNRIVVLPEMRGKGVSKKLFVFMISEIKKYYEENNSHLRKLYVLTHEENKKAQKFYENVGFKHEVLLKDHYYNGKNECLMSMFFD